MSIRTRSALRWLAMDELGMMALPLVPAPTLRMPAVERARILPGAAAARLLDVFLQHTYSISAHIRQFSV
jgi:hypothetical protein